MGFAVPITLPHGNCPASSTDDIVVEVHGGAELKLVRARQRPAVMVEVFHKHHPGKITGSAGMGVVIKVCFNVKTPVTSSEFIGVRKPVYGYRTAFSVYWKRLINRPGT